MGEKMRIGEFAKQAGVTPRTVRYYESIGLLEPGSNLSRDSMYGRLFGLSSF